MSSPWTRVHALARLRSARRLPRLGSGGKFLIEGARALEPGVVVRGVEEGLRAVPELPRCKSAVSSAPILQAMEVPLHAPSGATVYERLRMWVYSERALQRTPNVVAPRGRARCPACAAAEAKRRALIHFIRYVNHSHDAAAGAHWPYASQVNDFPPTSRGEES